MRDLVIVLGDQLNDDSMAFADFNVQSDVLWMAEVADESTSVWSHKARIALFLSAMRHFADRQRTLGRRVEYWALDTHACDTLACALTRTLESLRPQRIRLVPPGDWRVRQQIEQAAQQHRVPVHWCADNHFIMPIETFQSWANGRQQWRMEFWYREVRRHTGLLMESDQPSGGQ